MKKLIFISLIILTLITSCHNQDWEFEDYDYTTVYFAYQTPVRTILLGEDIYDNSLDNEHKCKIMATMGGVYENSVNRILDVTVDNSLCQNLQFGSGNAVLSMPSDYYSLPEDMEIVIPKGSRTGGIEVQLTDAFFADPDAITNTYIIPLLIENAQNVDSILCGEPAVENPNRAIATDWGTAPKDYILYCIKYINSWDATYLRRGQDVVVSNNGDNSLNKTNIYHEDLVVSDQVVKMNTVTLGEVSLSLSTRNGGSDIDIPFEIRLNFTKDGECTISESSAGGYTVSGTGKYVNNGDEWGDKARNVVYLDYSIDFGTTTHSFNDTLVVRDRDVVLETFTPTLVP